MARSRLQNCSYQKSKVFGMCQELIEEPSLKTELTGAEVSVSLQVGGKQSPDPCLDAKKKENYAWYLSAPPTPIVLWAYGKIQGKKLTMERGE